MGSPDQRMDLAKGILSGGEKILIDQIQIFQIFQDFLFEQGEIRGCGDFVVVGKVEILQIDLFRDLLSQEIDGLLFNFLTYNLNQSQLFDKFETLNEVPEEIFHFERELTEQKLRLQGLSQ